MSSLAQAWEPYPELVERSNIVRFMKQHGIADYAALLGRSEEHPEWFWDAVLKFYDLQFYKPYTRIMDTSRGIPWTRWCVGGTTNVVLNCLDRQIAAGLGPQPVVLWEGENGEKRQWSYAQLNLETCRLAHGLRRLGFKKGEVIGLYMPILPEAAAAYLAIIKIGCIVMPLFSGFGADAIVTRMVDAGAAGIVTADGTWRRGKLVGMKEIVDAAAARIPTLRHAVVFQRSGQEVQMRSGRDHWWSEVAAAGGAGEPTEEMDAEAPFMLMHTSGTTGKPKGTVHSHCSLTGRIALDMGLMADFKPGDRIQWMSDMGWLVGPLLITTATMLGGTMVIGEGTPDYPDSGRIWRLAAEHGTTFLGIAPTVVRNFMRYGDEVVDQYDLSKLRITVSTGEPWNPDAWVWFLNRVCRRKAPILNYSGGTEIGGGIIMSTVLHRAKPCSFTGPIPGTGAAVVNAKAEPVQPGETGELVMRLPSIGLTRSLWRDDARYLESYWNIIPGLWVQGDFATIDEDGLWYLHGRSDDTIKVAGKRLGPAEVESMLVATGKVLEAAAIGVPDDIKGQTLVCVCVPAPGAAAEKGLADELRQAVVHGAGPGFRPKAIILVSDLPKTRSMKIMRRVVRAIYVGAPPGDLSSLVNPEALEELRIAVGK
ncbi:MAG: AMP-binding protein [Betaproteobacteria bacterium]|nr:AMP-binding protein [Betaproteobacteria bacterium]